MKQSRLEALSALRRLERARALEALKKADAAASLAALELSAEQTRIESLRTALSEPSANGRLRGVALTAAFDDRRNKSAELSLARTNEQALTEKVRATKSALAAAQDEAAHAQKALSALEKKYREKQDIS